MIDYLKIRSLPISPSSILEHELLTFPLSNVSTHGEVLNRAQVAYWGNYCFRVKHENVKFEGSPHMNFEGGTNCGDFYLSNIRSEINRLIKTFDIDSKRALINFIEIGINIPLEIDPSKLIRCLILYKNKPFEPMLVKGKGSGVVCRLQQFDIKFYNKSLQNGLNSYLLRFEIKVKRMKFLETFGVYNLTLDDLIVPETYFHFEKVLLSILDDILLFDPNFEPNTIKNKLDWQLGLEGRYLEFWKDIPRSTLHRKKKRFAELSGGEKIKEELACKISDKWNKLTTCTENDLTVKVEQNNHLHKGSQSSDVKQNNHLQEIGDNTELKRINHTIESYSKRVCIVTGLDISDQKPTSKFISAVGLKLLSENKPENYLKLKKRFLPRTGISGKHPKHERDECSHLAKQIRSVDYNPRRYFQKTSEDQLNLF